MLIFLYSYTDNEVYKRQTNFVVFSVIMHGEKSMIGGHYICYVRRNNKWFICGDDSVQEINEKKIFDGNAYLLFYRKVIDNNI